MWSTWSQMHWGTGVTWKSLMESAMKITCWHVIDFLLFLLNKNQFLLGLSLCYWRIDSTMLCGFLFQGREECCILNSFRRKSNFSLLRKISSIFFNPFPPEKFDRGRRKKSEQFSSIVARFSCRVRQVKWAWPNLNEHPIKLTEFTIISLNEIANWLVKIICTLFFFFCYRWSNGTRRNWISSQHRTVESSWRAAWDWACCWGNCWWTWWIQQLDPNISPHDNGRKP